jgi:hypothetical protein
MTLLNEERFLEPISSEESESVEFKTAFRVNMRKSN